MSPRSPMSIQATTLTVGSVMTPDPVTINGEEPLSAAVDMMALHGVHHLPVVINGVVESVVSDRDLGRFLLPGHKLSQEEEPLVREVCPLRAYLADVNDPLDCIVEAMLETGVEAVPILREGELAGIFTRHDACYTLTQYLRS